MHIDVSLSYPILTHTPGNDAPPLHHYECEEVYTLRLVEQIVRQRGGVVAELEGQR